MFKKLKLKIILILLKKAKIYVDKGDIHKGLKLVLWSAYLQPSDMRQWLENELRVRAQVYSNEEP